MLTRHEPFGNLDLPKLLDDAKQRTRKIAVEAITKYLRGLLLQQHNLSMKAERLAQESTQAEVQRRAILEKIEAIQAGDWSALDPLELADKPDKKQEK